MNIIFEDLFCTQCSLQSDSSLVFNLHVKSVHGKKNETKANKNELEKQISIEAEVKSDVSGPNASDQESEKSFKSQICDINFTEKS